MSNLRLYNGSILQAKFTAEECNDGSFITTSWYPRYCLEVNRDVEHYETYSAALAKMYELALLFAMDHSQLRLLEGL